MNPSNPDSEVLKTSYCDQGRKQKKMLGGSAKGGSRLSCWRGEFEGEARVKGAKRPRIEGEARTEGEAREEAGEGSGEGAR